MALTYRNRTPEEIAVLERRYNVVPANLLEPLPVLPETREGCQALLIDLASEADDIRASSQFFKDVKLAVKQREMALVRQHMETLPAAELEGINRQLDVAAE